MYLFCYPFILMNTYRNNGPVSSSGTGPSADHTTGTEAGYYLYIESTPPVAAGT